MKKLIITLAVSMFFLYSFITTAQISPNSSWTIDQSWSPPKFDTSHFKIGINTSMRSVNDYNCPSNAVFGQGIDPDNLFYAFYSLLSVEGNDTLIESIVIDDFYNVNSDVQGINFWGFLVDESGTSLYTQPITLDFMLLIWTDPNSMDEPDQFINISAIGQPFYLDDDDESLVAFRFTANLPESIFLNDGWISIMQVFNINDPALFAWFASPDGDEQSFVMGYDIFQNYVNEQIPIDFAFCLTDYQFIPLKNWGIYFAILLFIGFALYRFRRQYV